MKVCMFHLMPYRDLPTDFGERYQSAFLDPGWFDVADADRVGQYHNSTLDELVYAAKAGVHGVCTNQHLQNVYGFMANPSLMGSVLARETAGQRVAIIQIGSTLPSTSPPTRIAEEYAMLDCLSGGRLIAGFPAGLSTDATISNGVVLIEQRERYKEALELVLKAWSAPEPFTWNGRHYQLPHVNLWPRPDPAAAPTSLDPGLGERQHGRACRRSRRLLLPFELRGPQQRPNDGRLLLGHGSPAGARRQSVSLRVSAARRGLRD